MFKTAEAFMRSNDDQRVRRRALVQDVCSCLMQAVRAKAIELEREVGLDVSGDDSVQFIENCLVFCRRDSFTKSLDLCEDGICCSGPCKWMGVFVPMVGESLNPTDQFLDLVEGSPSDCSPGNNIKPDLHLVEPGRIRGREVELEPRVLC